MNGYKWLVCEVNPEPWAIGDLSVGRRGGKTFPMVGRNHQLHAYKEAVKEALKDRDTPWIEGKIELVFYFSRNIARYTSPQARGARSHEADLTNLQKATEDALQGVLFKNDKDVVHCESFIVGQSPDVKPLLVIGIREAQYDSPVLHPDAMQAVVQYWDEQEPEVDPNAWEG